MESSKERELKLAAAKKRLKKFKTQKGSKHTETSPSASDHGASFGDSSVVTDSSAVESLLQLSNQLNGLLDDSANPDRSVTNGSATYSSSPLNGTWGSPKGRRSPIGGVASSANEENLMMRNRELADRVKQLQQKNTQLTRQMQIQTEHLSELEKQLNTSETESAEKAKHELQQTREQLQVHIQTIGILVEEKQTLQKQLSTAQKHSQQKSDEIEDFTSRLKASRLRVADLEKQLAVSNTQKARAESASGDNSKQLDKLKQELYTKGRDLEEVLEQRAQLEKQLQSKVTINSELEASLSDLKGKLDMSQAYIQQLNNGESPAIRPDLYAEQIEELKGQNTRLHENIAQLQDSLQMALADRNQTIDQYNQIINSQQHDQQQIHSELESSHKQITFLQQQIQDFQHQNSNLQTHIDELESADAASPPPADPVTPDVAAPATPPANTYSEEQLQQVLYQYEQLRLQCEAYAKNCEVLRSDNQQLSRLLEEKDDAVSELESTMERIQDEKDNSKRLLETVEGDKSALSRALSQNKQLKSQLEELENRFIKIAEDNMNALTSLQSAEHANKELLNTLADKEDLLQRTGQSLSEKQSFIAEHQEQMEHVAKMSHQQEQLADRIRHYEAQIQVMSALQRELHSSQETVRALTEQNSQLRDMIVQKGTSRQNSAAAAADTTDSSESDSTSVGVASSDTASSATTSPSMLDQTETVQQLMMAIRQLEAERIQLQSQCEETISENTKLSNQLLSQTEPSLDSGRVTKQQYEALQHALDSLQDKYTLIMRNKAELLDRSEILEYENMQLQAESETINEYISLYHHQRSLMKVRAEEKDKYIQQLSEEREKVSVKLAELQSLVVRLLQERQMLHSYSTNHPKPGQLQPGQPKPGLQPEQSGTSPSEDWPDYSSDADTAAEEATTDQSPQLATGHVAMDTSIDSTNGNRDTSTPLLDLSHDFIDGGERVPGVTAQRIMTLLSEIGHTNKMDRDKSVSHILHCSHCSGPVVTM